MRPLPTPAEHLANTRAALDSLATRIPLLDGWGLRLANLLPAGQRLLVAGNGGSAAEAQHLAAEFVGRYRDDRAPYSALALHAETSSLTAILNDYGDRDVFARQVHAHGRPGDVLLLMSTSGRSENLLAAAMAGSECVGEVWAMTGSRPNPLADLADEAVTIDAPTSAAVQEAQLVALHILVGTFDDCVANQLALEEAS